MALGAAGRLQRVTAKAVLLMVRLPERGHHTVEVTPRRQQDGNLLTTMARVSGDPIRVSRVWVTPNSLRGAASRVSIKASKNADSGGRTLRSHWSIFGSGTWPGRDGDLVTVIEGPRETGRRFRQEGDPEYRGFSSRTEHYSVLLRAISQEGGPFGAG